MNSRRTNILQLPNSFFMLRFFLFSIAFAWGRMLFSQVDTLLIAYPAPDDSRIINSELQILENDRLGIIQTWGTQQARVIIANNNGQILYERTFGEISGFYVVSCSYMFESDSGYVFIGNAEKNGAFHFVSFSSSKDLEQWKIVDSIYLEDKRFYVNTAHFNEQLGGWESFGVLQTHNGEIKDNGYIALSDEFTFDRFEILTNVTYKTHILDFVWIKEKEHYLLSPFGGWCMYVNADFETECEPFFTHTFQGNDGVTYQLSQRIENFFGEANGKVGYYYTTYQIFNLPASVGYAVLDFECADFLPDTLIYLNSPTLNIGEIGSMMQRDLQGNYIMSTVNGMTLFSNPTVPNRITVAKFSPTFERLWAFEYFEDESFVIWDMETDNEGNICLVGESRNVEGNDAYAGFFMKIPQNGFTTDVAEPQSDIAVTIYPNPADFRLCLQTKNFISGQLQMFDVNGRIVADFTMTDSFQDQCFNLPRDFKAGVYFTVLKDKDGRMVARKRVIFN